MASVSRISSPSIPMTESLHNHIKRAQDLKMPFVLYEELDTQYSSALAPATLKSYLIPCFLRRRKPASQSLTLARIVYKNGISFRRHAISIPKDTSLEDMKIIRVATDVLSHSEFQATPLDNHDCDLCKIITQHMMLMGSRFSYIIEVLNSDDPAKKALVQEERDRLKRLSYIITECVARRKPGLFAPEFLGTYDIRPLTTIHTVETPCPPSQDAPFRVPSVRPMSVRAGSVLEPVSFSVTRVDSEQMDVPMTLTVVDFALSREPPAVRKSGLGRSSTGAMRTSSRSTKDRQLSAVPFARPSTSERIRPVPRRLPFCNEVG